MLEASKYVKRLIATDSLNEKKAIIREAAIDGCSEFFEGFRLAYDKRRVFGVKKVPVIEGDFDQSELEAPSTAFNWDEFLDLVKKLEKRELTGNAAKEALHDAAKIACIEDWNTFYRPILIKDMRCGTSETIVNKVLKEIGGEALDYLTPVWKVQLATDSKKHPKKMVGKKAIDPKLDGVRLTTVLDKEAGTVRMFTRNGKENTNFASIIKGLEGLLPLIPISIVLDGEIVSDNFQALMTQVNRKDDVDTSDAHYALFDMLSLADFEKGKCPMTQMDRHEGLIELMPLLQKHTQNNVYVIPKLLVDLDTQEGKDKMAEFYTETVAAGYEGIMVKDVNAPYECKRTTTWLKWKPVDSVDLKVVGLEEGTGRNEGRFGAFVCEGKEDGKTIQVNVGTGYSDDQRDAFWAEQKELIGEIIEIEFDPDTETRFTKSESGDSYSLRFPRFKRFRTLDGKGKV